jgi:peptide/nickel transport system substrate-binding protein
MSYRLLVGILAAALLGACSRTGAVSRTPATLRFDLAADPASLNPLFIDPDSASVEAQLARLSFEPFVDVDARGRAVPELLARIPSRHNGGISADGRTIVYHLRKGVRWSDGRPVTSADVLYTLQAILDPANPVRSREGYDDIERAVAHGPHVVVFHLKHAWAPAIATYFSDGADPQFVLPAHVLQQQGPLARAAFNAAPTVGDGPYRFVSWKRGDSLRYVANPRYWRGKPRIATLDVRIVPDPSTNLLMLQSGAIAWNLIAPSQYAIVKHDAHLRFITTPTAVVAALVFNTSRPPLNDVRVRRALAMSIDRAGISAKLTLGKYPVTNMLQPQFSWAYDPAIREPGFDPARAASLLTSAGWHPGASGMRVKDGRALRLTYVEFPESATGVRVAETVQEELRNVGVAVNVKSVSSAQLFLPQTGTLASGKFDLAYVTFTMGADPDDSFVLRCHASSNYMRWCDTRVDALEREALASESQARRKALYARIGAIVAKKVPLLYLFNADYIYAYRRRLRGFDPNAFLPTWNAGSWSLRQP